MIQSFAGKNVVITGGSRGLGECLVRRFLECNANVVTCARHLPELQKMAKSLSGGAGRLAIIKADLQKISGVNAFCSSVKKESSRVDILVNNAGVPGPANGIKGITPAVWAEVIDTNIRAEVFVVRSLLPVFGPRASIVNISSCLGVTGSPDKTPYSFSKAALNIFTKDMAKELGPSGIRVNAVAPMIMATTFRGNKMLISRNKNSIIKTIPLRRIPSLDDVADAVMFLSGESASSISGVILPVDGGRGY